MTALQYQMRQASPDDLDQVIELLTRRREWLEARGSDQWSTNRHRLRPRMDEAIRTGRTWLLTDLNRRTLGTITITTEGDRDFWTADELATRALYLSRLATDPDYAGHELGRVMLDWALWMANKRGCAEVRLDAWKTAAGLHEYYVQHGWTYLRTVQAPGRYSGALFSRSAEHPPRIPELIFNGVTDGEPQHC